MAQEFELKVRVRVVKELEPAEDDYVGKVVQWVQHTIVDEVNYAHKNSTVAPAIVDAVVTHVYTEHPASVIDS